jgi:hypothetical protein
MAQTVAIQRGTTVLTSASSPTTIYTQSGGNATRVIWNFIAVYQAGGNNFGSVNSLNISHFSSSGGSAPIGYFKNNLGWGNFAILPNQGSSSFNQYAPGYSGSSVLYPLQGIVGSYSATSYTGNLAANQTSFVSPQANLVNPSMFLPQNCWIGPSDTLKLAFADNNGFDATVGWSFVTITES